MELKTLDLENNFLAIEEEFSNLSLENNYDEIEENRKITERLKHLDKKSLPNNLFKE